MFAGVAESVGECDQLRRREKATKMSGLQQKCRQTLQNLETQCNRIWFSPIFHDFQYHSPCVGCGATQPYNTSPVYVTRVYLFRPNEQGEECSHEWHFLSGKTSTTKSKELLSTLPRRKKKRKKTFLRGKKG